MENQQEKDACSSRRCCGKTLAAVALLAVGAAGGYFAGKNCAMKCAVPAAVEAPAQPGK